MSYTREELTHIASTMSYTREKYPNSFTVTVCKSLGTNEASTMSYYTREKYPGSYTYSVQEPGYK